MAIGTVTRPARVASPQRWQKALQRALDADVRAYQLSDTGEWVVTSGSKPGVAYRTSVDDCSCEAAMLGGDPVCQHRAAVRMEMGLLWPEAPTPEPESPAPAPVAPRVPVWASMLAAADGRMGVDSKESRQRRRDRLVAATS